MRKTDACMVNKIFTIPYFDKMIDIQNVPEAFLTCVKRYVRTENATVGDAISEIYHRMDREYRNEYFYKNTIFNLLLLQKRLSYGSFCITIMYLIRHD